MWIGQVGEIFLSDLIWAHQVNVEMSKPPLRDGDGLLQQVGVAVDLAVQAGFCPPGDIVGKAVRDKPRRHKAPKGQLPRVGNAVQMQKNVFS
jgi:hypothetical protein